MWHLALLATPRLERHLSVALQLHSALHALSPQQPGTLPSPPSLALGSALNRSWHSALFGTLPSLALCLPWHLALSALASTWLCLQSQLALPLLALCLLWHLTLSLALGSALNRSWHSALIGSLPLLALCLQFSSSLYPPRSPARSPLSPDAGFRFGFFGVRCSGFRV